MEKETEKTKETETINTFGINQRSKRTWSIFDATMTAERCDEDPQEEIVEAWAILIKTGLCWKLQGWFGRNAHNIIEGGSISAEGVIDWDFVDEKMMVG